MKTVIAIRSGMPDVSGLRRPADLFSGEEIDRLDTEWFDGLSRAELIAMRRKLSDTFDWLDPGDCGIGSPEMLAWENRLDRLQDLMDNIDERLNPEDTGLFTEE